MAIFKLFIFQKLLVRVRFWTEAWPLAAKGGCHASSAQYICFLLFFCFLESLSLFSNLWCAGRIARAPTTRCERRLPARAIRAIPCHCWWHQQAPEHRIQMELNGIGSSDRGNNTNMGNIVGNLGATKQSLYFCLQWPNELIRKSEV